MTDAMPICGESSLLYLLTVLASSSSRRSGNAMMGGRVAVSRAISLR